MTEPQDSLFSPDTLAGLRAAAAELTGADRAVCNLVEQAVATADSGNTAAAAALLRDALPRTRDIRLLYLGFQFFFRTEDRDEAERLARRRLEILSETGLSRSPAAARAWNNLGLIAFFREDLDEAQCHFEHALALDRAAADDEGIARDIGNLALIPEKRGDLAKAEAMYLESLAIAERIGADAIAATKLSNLGEVALARGRPEDARNYWLRAIAAYQRVGQKKGQVRCAEWIAALDTPSAPSAPTTSDSAAL